MGHNSSDFIHVLVEAVRLTLADALHYLGDQQHVTVPVETLLDKSYSYQRAQHISMDRCVRVWKCLCGSVGTSVYQSDFVDFR